MQPNTYTRENKAFALRFSFHAPVVKKAGLHGETVRITYDKGTAPLVASASMCERLANVETVDQIIAFTRDYGQIETAGTTGGIPRDPQFTINEWRAHQSWVRSFWNLWSGTERPTEPCTSLAIGGSDFMLDFSGDGVFYRVKTLRRLLEIYLAAIPPAHLKKCQNVETCKSPYIISDDSRVKQCGSEECRQWVHKQASKDYRANGPKRVAARLGGKNESH